jgi:RNA polymerase sigma-70 factor (ECF subfamily)
MEPDGKRLVDRIRNGDPQAAVALVDLFYERIYAFLRRLSGQDADAADLTQRTFTRVWQALPSYAAQSSVVSWIHGIARHVYLDWHRRERRSEARPDEWWAAHPATAPGPDELAARSDLSSALFASVETLEPDLRDTIHLHFFQGLTLEETAEAMGVAVSTVKYRQRQAVELLQQKLAGEPAGARPKSL